MAVYGYDLFLKSKYGGKQLVDFGVDPFIADATNYTTVLLSWHEPSGTWSQFRLLRSRSGFASNENDGALIYSQTDSTMTPGVFTDNQVFGGWNYYTIFLYDTTNSEWVRAAIADTLVPYDYNSQETIWDLIPEHYKLVRDTGAGYSQALYNINPEIYLNSGDAVHNDHLLQWLGVFGWGLNVVRSHIDTTLDGYDTNRMHVNRLALLAEQMGGDIELTVPAQANRNMVRNLGLLHRKRGTLDGIEELLSISTGLDFDVSIGRNLMLSEDQANFISPQIELWDQGTLYEPGDHVRYINNLYEAQLVVGGDFEGPYGAAQAPPITPGNNTWWNKDVFVDPVDSTKLTPYVYDDVIGRTCWPSKNPDTDDVGTWQVVRDGVPVSGNTHIGQGTPDLVDSTLVNHNSLGFINPGATSDIIVRSIPCYINQTDLDRQLVVESAIPIPRVTALWSATEVYDTGDRVLWRGAPYEALLDDVTALPSVATEWKKLGYDKRTRLALSFYSHGPYNGSAGTGGVTIHPYVITFDDKGDMLQELTLAPASLVIDYAAFNEATTPDIGGAWANTAGALSQSWDDDGGMIYPSGAGQTYVIATGTADANVGVTFRSVGTRAIGLALRWTSATQYFRVDATEIRLVNGSQPGTLLDTHDSPFVSGDRMKVNLSGNDITVYKNGVLVSSANSSTFNTVTKHGIIVEA